MADLNRNMMELQKKFSRIGVDLKDLLVEYDGMFREINNLYLSERLASGNSNGLEDFFRLLQTVKRNRDVIASVLRGCSGYRPVDKFKIVEEDVPAEKRPVRRKSIPVHSVQDQPLQNIEEHIEELV